MATLQAEYDDLIHVKRPDAVLRLSNARELGDLSENSEYSGAKESLAFMDGRITELEEILHGAKVITTHSKHMWTWGAK